MPFPRNPTSAAPPAPADPYELARWTESARRRRQLDGTWREDLRLRLSNQLGSVRTSAWGPISLALNPFASIIRELSVLYAHPPEVLHDDVAEAAVAVIVEERGLWAMMSRVMQYVLGQRECFVRVDVAPVLNFRPVYVDLVLAQALPAEPSKPAIIREYRLRVDPETGDEIWTVECLSIVGEPYYRIHRAEGSDLGEDLTEHYLGRAFEGDAYPYRYADGTPFLPYVLYHAERVGDRMFDPYRLSELAEGSLDAAVLHQMLMHTYRQASWPQRWVANLEPASMDVTGQPGQVRREIVTDPATLLVLRQARDLEDAGQPMVGQWDPGGDVATLEETLSNIVARLAQEAGVPASDIQRLGGTARSGVAISLTNEGKRAAQRAYRNAFRVADEELIGKTAALLNRSMGLDLPESGYRVVYGQVPLSPDEIKARREDVFELLERGMISRVGAYARLNPGISRTQAARALDGIEGRADAVDEIRAAREEINDLVDQIDQQHAARLRLMSESLDHGLRLLNQELAEDVAESGGY